VPCLRVTAAADGEDDGMYLVSRTIHHSCVFFWGGGRVRPGARGLTAYARHSQRSEV
jgi:hypothetical protein